MLGGNRVHHSFLGLGLVGDEGMEVVLVPIPRLKGLGDTGLGALVPPPVDPREKMAAPKDLGSPSRGRGVRLG